MILQIFNKYLQMGGEEKSVERIRKHAIEAGLTIEKCFFDSAEWQQEGAPGKFGQLKRLFYNHESAARLETSIVEHSPKALLLHNIYPVGSPAILDVAQKNDIPVIQYVHNFRPFSVGGTLYAKGRYCPESLDGNFWPEIKGGAWQGSVLKSLLMAQVLKRVQRSGWLDNVKAWICISDYMAEAFARAGVPEEKLHVLHHSWDARVEENAKPDLGYYLFLGRLTGEKGIQVILDTWTLLERELGENTPKLVIGGDGPMLNVVQNAAEKSQYIEYKGLVSGDEKSGLIAKCRGMLAPSVWQEPLGLVTYEAQDYSRAMFAAASGGLKETTEHGVTGFLHEPGNHRQLAEQIKSYQFCSEATRAKIGKAARDKLLKDASAENWKNQFIKIVDNVVGS